MRILVINHHTDQRQAFEGSPEQVEAQLLDRYPWLKGDGQTPSDPMATLEYLDATGAFQVELVDEVQLQPGNLLGDVSAPTDEEAEVVRDMLGFQPALTESFQAARFLAGGGEVSLERMRRALYQHEGDLDAAALSAYGFEPSPANLAALQAVRKLESVKKAEPVAATASEVEASVPEGHDVARSVQAAYADQFVFPVKLGGKHSAGSLLARDQAKGKTWLLKPGSGGQSPAAGAKEDSSTQSAREAAFFHVAKAWGLSGWFSRAELLLVDHRQYAALELLPWSFKTLEKRRQAEPGSPRKLLERARGDGTLHRWAVLDFVCGNPDRHGQNVMVDGDQVKLIDHGSAFAGWGFDPAQDEDSFVPFYLRAWAPLKFNTLSPAEKLGYMPRVNEKTAVELGGWVQNLSEDELAFILHRYGIDPRPSLARLERLRALAATMPVDEAIDRLWVTT